MKSTSNEKDIRNKIKEIILRQDESIVVVDEFCGGTMQTRSDLALFKSDMLIMIEIKSNKDVLLRLENQVRDYSEYSTNVFIVLDIIHKKNFFKLYEKSNILRRVHFEIFWYDNNKITYQNREILKFSKFHFRAWTKTPSLYKLLWRDEKKQLLYFIKGRSKANLDEAIKYIYTYNEIYEISNLILYDRVRRNINIEKKKFSINNNLIIGKYDNIKYKEYKQLLFNDYLITAKG